MPGAIAKLEKILIHPINYKARKQPPKLGYDHRKTKNNDVQSQTRIHSIMMSFVSMATPCFSLA